MMRVALGRRSGIGLVLAFLLLVVSPLVAVDSGRAGVLDPQITVSPDSGAPGDPVEVSGTGFAPFSTLFVGFSQDGTDQVIGIAAADVAGGFSAVVSVPVDALPGLALFFAQGSAGRAEADFSVVLDSEPIGGGPPSVARVPVCEVTLILEKVRSRIGTVAGEDTLEIQTVGKQSVKVVVPRNRDWTPVATTVSKTRVPKSAFPRPFGIRVSAKRLNDATLSFSVEPKTRRRESAEPSVDCPGSAVVEFSREEARSLELYSGPNFFGDVDVSYRIIVREVNDQ